MERGLIHLYCGDGKGKTTACTGLAVRAVGAGKKVVFTQFLKNFTSSEIKILEDIGIEIVRPEHSINKFTFKMTAEEKELSKMYCKELLEKAFCAAEKENADMLILDECASAEGAGMLNFQDIKLLLLNKPLNLEVVLSGRCSNTDFYELCDYVSEIKKLKHPYDKGISARRGIEF